MFIILISINRSDADGKVNKLRKLRRLPDGKGNNRKFNRNVGSVVLYGFYWDAEGHRIFLSKRESNAGSANIEGGAIFAAIV